MKIFTGQIKIFIEKFFEKFITKLSKSLSAGFADRDLKKRYKNWK